MLDNDVLQAQSRVREMNRMNRQLAARSNRYINNIIKNTMPAQGAAADSKTAPEPPPAAQNARNQHYARRRGQGTRFVPLFGADSAARPHPAAPAPTPPPQRHTAPSSPVAPSPAPPPPVHTPQYKTFRFPKELSIGGADREKLIIAALMALLYKEKADIKLILALGYLIM